MQIIGARQQIQVSQQQTQYQGRFDALSAQQLVNHTSQATTLSNVLPPRTTLSQAPTATTNKLQLPEAPKTDKTQNQSTSDTEENEEDCKQFSALHTIGQVKKILEQLVSGKLTEWLSSEQSDLTALCHQVQGDGAGASMSNDTDSKPPPAQRPASDQVLVNYRYQQLSASFTGEVSLSDGTSMQWDFQFAHVESEFNFVLQRAAEVKDPLVLSLDGSFRATGQWLNFAMSADTPGRLDKLSGAQYYLVHDKNQNGKADDGSELFGPNSGQGFAELAQLDDDGNGFIDAADRAFHQLYAWQPEQGLRTMSDLQIGALSVTSASTQFDYYQQQQLQARLTRSGVALTTNRQVGLLQQVDFTV